MNGALATNEMKKHITPRIAIKPVNFVASSIISSLVFSGENAFTIFPKIIENKGHIIDVKIHPTTPKPKRILSFKLIYLNSYEKGADFFSSSSLSLSFSSSSSFFGFSFTSFDSWSISD